MLLSSSRQKETTVYGFEKIIGRPLASVEVLDDGNILEFAFADGSRQFYRAEGDCCSRSWIEHLTVPDGIAGQQITEVKDSEGTEPTPEELAVADSLQVYATAFATPVGEIVVEYRNDSNGYYGGSLDDAGTEAGSRSCP